MKKRGKVLALCLCAVLLVASSVFVTIAYLTSTDSVTNTFTVGKVAITLDEAKVNEYGELKKNDQGECYRVKENKYKLIPGHEYTKDPTVHVGSESENCWIFVKVENGISGIEGGTTIASQMENKGWEKLKVDDAEVPNVYYYNGIESDNKVGKIATAGNNYVVFDNFTVKSDADVSGYAGKIIAITAYAIQADGFGTAAEAWATAGSSF